jgi:hypothetical protein
MSRARDLGSSINSITAGKNVVINGNFDFFQRGSLSTTTAGYGLDRWYQSSSGSGTNVSVTQQTTGVPSGSRHCMRVTMTGVNGYGNQYQVIETLNTVPLQGKIVTLSAKLRRSSGYAGNITMTLEKSATVDASMGGTWTTLAAQGVLNSSLPTGTTSSDWHSLQFSVFIPNDGTANSLKIGFSQSQTESNCYWEVSQVQVEAGSSATTFSRAGGDIQGELAKCQRYYYQTDSYVTGSYSAYNSGNFISSSFNFPVTMRAVPSVLVVSDTATNSNKMTQYPLGGSAVTNITPPSALILKTTHWFYEAGGTSNGAQGTGGAFALRYNASAEL